MAETKFDGPRDEESGLTQKDEPPSNTITNPGGRGDVAPPSYNAATDPPDVPPTYESLYGRVKAAKRESSGLLVFMKTFLVIIVGSIGCTIMIAFLLAIPISMIVIGSMYLDDCPAQRYIPIYLIVSGVFGIIKLLTSICQRAKNQRDLNEDQNAKPNPFDGILGCFLFAWFIAGNVWIYWTLHKFQSDDDTLSTYCHATLYWFSFWITTSVYILNGMLCCGLCCMALISTCFSSD